MSRTPEERAFEVMETAQWDKATIFGNMFMAFVKVEIPETEDVVIIQHTYVLEEGKEHDMEKIIAECVDILTKKLCAALRMHYSELDAAQE